MTSFAVIRAPAIIGGSIVPDSDEWYTVQLDEDTDEQYEESSTLVKEAVPSGWTSDVSLDEGRSLRISGLLTDTPMDTTLWREGRIRDALDQLSLLRVYGVRVSVVTGLVTWHDMVLTRLSVSRNKGFSTSVEVEISFEELRTYQTMVTSVDPSTFRTPGRATVEDQGQAPPGYECKGDVCSRIGVKAVDPGSFLLNLVYGDVNQVGRRLMQTFSNFTVLSPGLTGQ